MDDSRHSRSCRGDRGGGILLVLDLQVVLVGLVVAEGTLPEDASDLFYC